MSILVQLGANSTAFIQFCLFAFSITFLTLFVFGPYFKARDQRIERTKGGEELAQEATNKSQEMKSILEREARTLSAKIKEIFDRQRQEGQGKAEVIVTDAKQKATVTIEDNRKKLATTVAHVASELSKQAPQLANSIKEKLIG